MRAGPAGTKSLYFSDGAPACFEARPVEKASISALFIPPRACTGSLPGRRRLRCFIPFFHRFLNHCVSCRAQLRDRTRRHQEPTRRLIRGSDAARRSGSGRESLRRQPLFLHGWPSGTQQTHRHGVAKRRFPESEECRPCGVTRRLARSPVASSALHRARLPRFGTSRPFAIRCF